MDSSEIRRLNLMAIRDKYGREGASTRTGLSLEQVSQLTSPNIEKNIGKKIARRIEGSLGLPFGWMDKLHDDTTPEFMDLKEKGVIFPTPNIPLVPWERLIAGGKPMSQTDKAVLRTTAEVFKYGPDSVVTEIGGELLLIDCGAGPLPGKRVHVWVEGRGDLIRRYEKEGDVAFLLDPAGQLPAIEISDEINHLYKGRVVLTLTIE